MAINEETINALRLALQAPNHPGGNALPLTAGASA